MTQDIKMPKMLIALEGACDVAYLASKKGQFEMKDIEQMEKRIMEASSLLRQIKAESQVK